MNGLKCPNCNLVNMTSAIVCHRCQTSLSGLPPTAQVSVPVEETFQAKSLTTEDRSDGIPQDNELGRKTYFWYRAYLVVMTLMYLTLSGLGAFVIYMSQFETNAAEATEMFVNGIVLLIAGIPFAIIFAIGLILPRKPWNWIVGIIYIAFGMTSCCFLPVSIPLLIFWIKSETQAYFGRK